MLATEVNLPLEDALSCFGGCPLGLIPRSVANHALAPLQRVTPVRKNIGRNSFGSKCRHGGYSRPTEEEVLQAALHRDRGQGRLAGRPRIGGGAAGGAS